MSGQLTPSSSRLHIISNRIKKERDVMDIYDRKKQSDNSDMFFFRPERNIIKENEIAHLDPFII